MRISKIAYFIQLIFCCAIGLYFICIIDANIENSTVTITKDALLTGIVCAIFIGNFFRSKNNYLNVGIRWLSIITIPYISTYFLTEFFYVLADEAKGLANLLELVYLLVLLVWYLPIAKVEFTQVKNIIGRILAVMIIFLEVVATPEYLILNHLNYPLHLITNSDLIIGFAFFNIGLVLLKEWYSHNKFNLNLQGNKNFQFLLLLILTSFGVWFAFYQQFLGNANSISEALWNWKIQFSFMSFKLESILRSLNVISEETERYLLLTLFLIAFRNIKQKVPLTIIITALIFAINHYVYNIISPNPQSLYAVTLQVISAFGVGLFATTLYLYSGQFWLIYLLHAFIDFIAFSTPTSLQLGLTINGLTESLLIILPLVLVSILLLFGKTRKIMEINANKIIG